MGAMFLWTRTAACLTILGGFSQNFHWGSAWREMVLTAMELERAYYKLVITPDEQRDPISEMEQLHELILAEGKNFFDRLVGVSSKGEIQQLETITSLAGETTATKPATASDD